MIPLIARSMPSVAGTGSLCFQHLDACLPQVLTARIVLLSAPAGAGKTVALRRWAELLGAQGRRAAWLTLGDAIADLPELFAAIAQSIARAVPGWQHPEPLAADDRTDPEAAAAALSNAWLATGEPVALILDGLEHATPAATALVRQLVDGLPANGQLLVASRVLPDLGLSRLRLFGGLVEIGLAQLRFGPDEIRLLLGGRLSADQQGALMRATDGWAAGIGLASRTLDGGADAESMLRAVSGRA
ncbi:MAG: AAA family ATPase, partial [Janthinobacterium lividum]